TVQRCRVVDVVLEIDEPELERRRRAEHAFRLRRILDTGKLHENPVEALTLHDGLGHAELVHAVTQRDGVLLAREILPVADHRLRRPEAEPRPPADLRALDDQALRERDLLRLVELANDLFGARDIGLVLQRHEKLPVVDTKLRANARVAKLGPEVRLVVREKLIDGRVDVDLIEKVYAATQVEAERHRLQADRGEPRGRARRERQRDDVVR